MCANSQFPFQNIFPSEAIQVSRGEKKKGQENQSDRWKEGMTSGMQSRMEKEKVLGFLWGKSRGKEGGKIEEKWGGMGKKWGERKENFGANRRKNWEKCEEKCEEKLGSFLLLSTAGPGC